MSETGDFAAFMTARYDEAEARARAASSEHLCEEARDGQWQTVGHRYVRYDSGSGETVTAIDVKGSPALWYEQIWVKGDPDSAVATFIIGVDPKHRLEDIALKRAILALHRPDGAKWPICAECSCEGSLAGTDCPASVPWPCTTARQLGTEFSGHPDYRAEWKP